MFFWLSVFIAVSDNEGQRDYNKYRTMYFEYLPQIGNLYVDIENKSVYAIKYIFFSDTKISALIVLQSEERFEIYSKRF